MIGGVVLNEETGRYVDTQSAEEYVRVSDVLREFGLTDSRFYDEDSRTRGHAVHLAIKLIEKGTLDEESLDPIIVPWVEGYRKFKAELSFKAQYFEQAVCNRLWRFAGTLDLMGTIAGSPVLIDVKTGAAPKSAALQTGAYLTCLDDAHGVKRYVLELRNDATYRLVRFDDPADGRVFLGLAAINVI